MNFNRFSKADGVLVALVLFFIAVIFFGSNIGPKIKQLAFQLPVLPPTVTPTPTLTLTPLPSFTPTPLPTSTFTVTPIPTSAYLRGEVTSFWNEFDNTDLLRGDWEFSPNAKVQDGLLVIDHNDAWNGVYGTSHLHDGQTILIQFRFDAWSDLHFAVETGDFETDSYRSWGVGAENDLFSPVYSEGKREYGDSFISDELKLDPGTWYVLMLHIGGNKPFIARIWEYGNPENLHSVEIQLDESWQGKDWLPLFLVGPAGRLEIQRYEELRSYSGE
jgi:hypothetical protein